MDIFIYPYLPWIVGGGLALGALAIAGWVFTTWIRIKHGYPLENAWGMAVHPKVSTEAQERITLLTSENVQLRAELGSVKDRLATIERIVTDGSFRLENEIEQLRGPKN
ncbi:hypothetical protein [Sphingosinicella soli]|uniref:Uncharacterized protein n=1 Tax=Sphingosinicella soli TaxID=333708 RepID=A0A7W7B189_9SPHN|nr:hypothetical protein [Sphingosinicella soli]MBB4632024.1 hypothetical protein [Sphingosinicella soli]